jgi:hypothetical protein
MRTRLVAAVTIATALLVSLPTAAGARPSPKPHEKCAPPAGQISNHCKGGKK